MKKIAWCLIFSFFTATICFAFGPAIQSVLTVGGVSCFSLWRFESGALTTDTIGSQTLTDVNTVVADTSVYKEGAASADFEVSNSEYYYRADADLATGFPLKSDDAVKDFTWLAWIRMESGPTDEGFENTIISKYDRGTNKRTCRLTVVRTSNLFYLNTWFGYNAGAGYEQVTHATALSVATWYFVAIAYENSGKTWRMAVRDSSGNLVGTDATGTATLDVNKLSVTTANFAIGAGYNTTATDFWDGLIDRAMVYDRKLTADEITSIAKGNLL